MTSLCCVCPLPTQEKEAWRGLTLDEELQAEAAIPMVNDCCRHGVEVRV